MSIFEYVSHLIEVQLVCFHSGICYFDGICVLLRMLAGERN